jgi:hypothetical protein
MYGTQWRMGSSSPQEGGTTDEDYYGQPQQMLNKDLKPTAPQPKNLTQKLQSSTPTFCKIFNIYFSLKTCPNFNYIAA